jgi:AcrR family transcriptional regulator
MGKTSAVPLGRPCGFDRDAALDTAMQLFWRHGYEGVSISDLTREIGVAPPSLYAAFGSKAELFRKVLELYLQRPASTALRAFTQDGPIRPAVETMLRNSVRAVTDPNYPPGCMIAAGLMQSGPDHIDLAETIAGLRKARCAVIAARLQRAIDAGDLPTDTDPTALARYLYAVTQGIAVQARDGAAPDELNAIVDMTMRNWPG